MVNTLIQYYFERVCRTPFVILTKGKESREQRCTHDLAAMCLEHGGRKADTLTQVVGRVSK